MATTSKNLSGLYKQKKKTTGGITKSKSSSKASTEKKSPIHADVTQPSALISHGSVDLKDEHDENEEVLRQFDLNMAYGPCLGMSRLARWERAQCLGLNPPREIESLLKVGKVEQECLWDGRI